MAAPLKVDPRADEIATHSAHFLGITKKQFVSDAIGVYSEIKRAEIEKGVRSALESLDGSRSSAVQLLAGLTPEELEELGGLG